MIDTHCHLLSLDAENVIKNMNDDGLEKLVTISTTLDDSKKNVKLAEKNENVYATVGIYPEYAKQGYEADLAELEKLCTSKKVVAVGEIGLDYHTEGYNKDLQKQMFISQLEMANRLNLPFCVHCRNAADDVFEILSTHKNLLKNGGLMHCYSEGEKYVQKFLDLGMYISFSGNITFKHVDRSFVKNIPLSRILIETDSPYLCPEPKRGQKNEPKNVRYVLMAIADEYGISASKLDEITTKNAKNFYRIKD